MKKCPFHSLHDLSGRRKRSSADGVDALKAGISDSALHVLGEDTLKSIAFEGFSLHDLMPFVDELRGLLEGGRKEEIWPRLEEYLVQDGILKKLVYLKMNLNNLHIQMFWEYFQEELRKLWEHDFFAFDHGKIVNLPLENLTDPVFVATEQIKRREKWKVLQSLVYMTGTVGLKYLIRDGMLKSLDTCFRTNSLWNKSVIGFSNSLLLLNLVQKETFSGLYKDFVEKNKENEIVRGYVFLEHALLSKTRIKSDFNTIFPNTNHEFIKEYVLMKNYRGEKFSLPEFRDFLECQNRANIERALFSWNISSHIRNMHGIEFFVFDKEKNAYVLDLKNVPDEIIQETKERLHDSKTIKGTYNGACPYSMTKTPQGKNAFLELFSFFDQYHLKLVEQYLKHTA